jgi:hypothetical protein
MLNITKRDVKVFGTCVHINVRYEFKLIKKILSLKLQHLKEIKMFYNYIVSLILYTIKTLTIISGYMTCFIIKRNKGTY